MPYVVLALGLTMSVVGVIAVVTGYPIIQVERGWATVIAGATLFAGGIVTSALGLVLRALSGLRSALLRSPVERSKLDEPRFVPVQIETGYEEPARGEPTVAAPDVAIPVPGFPERALGRDEPSFAEFQPPPSEPGMVASDEAFGRRDHAEEPADEPRASVDSVASPRHEDLGLFDEPRLFDPDDHPSSEPEPDLFVAPSVPVAPEPPSLPSTQRTGNDWLDRSLADFDRENADLMTRAPTEPELPQVPHDPQPVDEDPIPEGPASPLAADAAVVGRYEADGTAYVMYADGSIEASSPAGVYRFASMAELRAFIEG